jgi:hypothetical protein
MLSFLYEITFTVMLKLCHLLLRKIACVPSTKEVVGYTRDLGQGVSPSTHPIEKLKG